MKHYHVAIAAFLITLVPSFGQSTSMGGGSLGNGPANHMGTALSQDQFNTLTDYADQAKRLTKADKAAGKTLKDVLAEDKNTAISLTKTMPLSCDVVDAMKVAEGPETVDGKTVNTFTYEAACTNGMGYFLISQEPLKPYGFSCFAADATKQADIAAGKKPGAYCKLPPNADMKLVAGKILTAAGQTCAVKAYSWVGQNKANHTEFDEVACEDGKGYMLIIALPGATIPVHVETCSQSAARGLPCKLSDNGVLPVTLKTFRDALSERMLACDANDQTTRVIGQVAAKKLYVVEFQCTQHPKGLVAYIPQPGSLAPFESMDCAAAAKRGANCALPGNK